MINPDSKRPVTIEDLLRLKRSERPPAEFWTEFDRELRAKQLAALVDKQPWWKALPHTLRGLAKYHLPLGATAVLAITLLSIRDYHPALPSQSAAESVDVLPATAVSAPEVTIAPATVMNEPPVAMTETNAAAPATVSIAPEEAPISTSADFKPSNELAQTVALTATHSLLASSTELPPSARSIAENRAVAEALLGTPSAFEPRAISTRSAPQEPLAQMTNPAETRRSRFAAAFASASADTSIVTSARVARRLSDDQLYDSIHRLGATGNTVSFKF